MSEWTTPYRGVSHYATAAHVATIADYGPFTTACYRRRGEGTPIERACFFAQPFEAGCLESTTTFLAWGQADHTGAARVWCEQKLR